MHKLISQAGAARALGVTRQRVSQMVRAGRLSSELVAGRRVVVVDLLFRRAARRRARRRRGMDAHARFASGARARAAIAASNR